MGLLFLQPALFLVGFIGLMESRTVPSAWLWLGLIIAVLLCSNAYGRLVDEFYETSALADPWKLQRLVEDLGQLAENMPLMRIVSSQEMGNLRYPTRLLFAVQGYNKPICYNWENGRFIRYKWTVVPLSIDKIIARAKRQT
jgi:hypothetical protein